MDQCQLLISDPKGVLYRLLDLPVVFWQLLQYTDAKQKFKVSCKQYLVDATCWYGKPWQACLFTVLLMCSESAKITWYRHTNMHKAHLLMSCSAFLMAVLVAFSAPSHVLHCSNTSAFFIWKCALQYSASHESVSTAQHVELGRAHTKSASCRAQSFHNFANDQQTLLKQSAMHSVPRT